MSLPQHIICKEAIHEQCIKKQHLLLFYFLHIIPLEGTNDKWDC